MQDTTGYRFRSILQISYMSRKIITPAAASSAQLKLHGFRGQFI